MKNSSSNPIPDTWQAGKGFSLVEILVAITITSLLIGFTSAVWLVGQQYYIRWERSFTLQNELHTLVHGITEDIYRADEIIDIKPETITLKTGDDLREYYSKKEDLLRDSLSLLDAGITLVRFQLTTSLSEKKPENADNQSAQMESEKVQLVDLKLALANRNDTLVARRLIYLRKPSTWKSMTENR